MKHEYRIQGLTCTSCAMRFEKSINKLPGVQNAQVNFGASKLTIIGQLEKKKLRRLAAMEGLSLIPDTQSVMPKRPWYKQSINYRIILSSLLLCLSLTFILNNLYPDTDLLIRALYILAICIAGSTLFWRGFQSLFRLEFNMNTLMTLATCGAIAIDEWGEAAAVVILFALSESLERHSMENARHSIQSLMELSPNHAIILSEGTEKRVPITELKIGDTVVIKPGSKVPADGVVMNGHSYINESSITGESMPKLKDSGDTVFAGTLNTEGFLQVEVTKHTKDTALSKIIHLVEEAQAKRSTSQAFIERFAKVYTPLILILASLVTTVPPLFFSLPWEEWVYRGLTLLVVGCPCALVISTPLAIVTAIGAAARQGVLIKGGIYLEQGAKITTVAFDKTGTLTTGALEVTDFLPLNERYRSETLGIAAAMEKQSQHPIAMSVRQATEKENIDYTAIPITSFVSIPGKGITANIEEQTYYLGNPSFIKESNGPLPSQLIEIISTLQNEGKTVIILSKGKDNLGIFALKDTTRKNSPLAIKILHQAHIETVMLTGDNEAVARSVQSETGIKSYKAQLLPEEKWNEVRKMEKNNRKVAMIGDGVNDTPALASASLGIAMGTVGTDTALETADIVLMGDDLLKVPYVITLSKKTLIIIKQNVTLSLALKSLALLLIIPGWLTLWMAILADMGATLLVTLNSVRVRKGNDKNTDPK